MKFAPPDPDTPYSQRRRDRRQADGVGFERDDAPPWRLDELIEAQRMACCGTTSQEIAEHLGRTVADVEHRLEPPEAAPPGARPARTENSGRR